MDAATCVVLRPGAHGEAELFMVRRSRKSRFMPSTYVFPGGRVDPEDGPASSDAAFERAARRESQEEAGLQLAQRPMQWFDTWVTPSAEPRRYRARFFLCLLGAGEGTSARADGLETHEGRWATAATLLQDWEAGTYDLPPPTLAILLRLRGRSLAHAEQLAGVDPRPPILPKWVQRHGHGWVVLPHAPEYPELEGASAPAPPRAHDFPPRFRRDSNKWVPWHHKL